MNQTENDNNANAGESSNSSQFPENQEEWSLQHWLLAIKENPEIKEEMHQHAPWQRWFEAYRQDKISMDDLVRGTTFQQWYDAHQRREITQEELEQGTTFEQWRAFYLAEPTPERLREWAQSTWGTHWKTAYETIDSSGKRRVSLAQWMEAHAWRKVNNRKRFADVGAGTIPPGKDKDGYDSGEEQNLIEGAWGRETSERKGIENEVCRLSEDELPEYAKIKEARRTLFYSDNPTLRNPNKSLNDFFEARGETLQTQTKSLLAIREEELRQKEKEWDELLNEQRQLRRQEWEAEIREAPEAIEGTKARIADLQTRLTASDLSEVEKWEVEYLLAREEFQLKDETLRQQIAIEKLNKNEDEWDLAPQYDRQIAAIDEALGRLEEKNGQWERQLESGQWARQGFMEENEFITGQSRLRGLLALSTLEETQLRLRKEQLTLIKQKEVWKFDEQRIQALEQDLYGIERNLSKTQRTIQPIVRQRERLEQVQQRLNQASADLVEIRDGDNGAVPQQGPEFLLLKSELNMLSGNLHAERLNHLLNATKRALEQSNQREEQEFLNGKRQQIKEELKAWLRQQRQICKEYQRMLVTEVTRFTPDLEDRESSITEAMAREMAIRFAELRLIRKEQRALEIMDKSGASAMPTNLRRERNEREKTYHHILAQAAKLEALTQRLNNQTTPSKEIELAQLDHREILAELRLGVLDHHIQEKMEREFKTNKITRRYGTERVNRVIELTERPQFANLPLSSKEETELALYEKEAVLESGKEKWQYEIQYCQEKRRLLDMKTQKEELSQRLTSSTENDQLAQQKKLLESRMPVAEKLVEARESLWQARAHEWESRSNTDKDKLRKEVSQLRTELDQLTAPYRPTEKTLKEIGLSLERLTSSQEEIKKTLQQKWEWLQGARVKAANGQAAERKARLDALNNRLNTTEKKLQTLAEKLDPNDPELNKLQTHAENIKTVLARLQYWENTIKENIGFTKPNDIEPNERRYRWDTIDDDGKMQEQDLANEENEQATIVRRIAYNPDQGVYEDQFEEGLTLSGLEKAVETLQQKISKLPRDKDIHVFVSSPAPGTFVLELRNEDGSALHGPARRFEFSDTKELHSQTGRTVAQMNEVIGKTIKIPAPTAQQKATNDLQSKQISKDKDDLSKSRGGL